MTTFPFWGDLGSLDTVHRHNPPNFAAILLRCYSYPDVFYEKVTFANRIHDSI